MEIQDIIARINAELAKIAADAHYENDDAENEIFDNIKANTGWTPEDESEEKYAWFLGGNNHDRLSFALNYLQPRQQTEAEILADIEQKIKESCTAARYANLCIRIQTPGGMAYVVNRCITMMARDKMHLSAALANLEAEEEGID